MIDPALVRRLWCRARADCPLEPSEPIGGDCCSRLACGEFPHALKSFNSETGYSSRRTIGIFATCGRATTFGTTPRAPRGRLTPGAKHDSFGLSYITAKYRAGQGFVQSPWARSPWLPSAPMKFGKKTNNSILPQTSQPTAKLASSASSDRIKNRSPLDGLDLFGTGRQHY